MGVPELLGCRCVRLCVCARVFEGSVSGPSSVRGVCARAPPWPSASSCGGSGCLGSTCFPAHVLAPPLSPTSLGVCNLFFVVLTSPSPLPSRVVHRKALWGGVGWGWCGVFSFLCVYDVDLTAPPSPLAFPYPLYLYGTSNKDTHFRPGPCLQLAGRHPQPCSVVESDPGAPSTSCSTAV